VYILQGSFYREEPLLGKETPPPSSIVEKPPPKPEKDIGFLYDSNGQLAERRDS
jgi:hypothetical protein